MPEEIGGKIFYSAEESGPLDPEMVALAKARVADRIKELEAQEELKKRPGYTPPPHKEVSGRFGRDDFVGTEYEQWANNAWAEDDREHEGGEHQ